MSLPTELRREVDDLLWALRGGVATREELARLESLVCDNPAVRSYYVRYMDLCASLHWTDTTESEVESPHAVESPADLEAARATVMGWLSAGAARANRPVVFSLTVATVFLFAGLTGLAVLRHTTWFGGARGVPPVARETASAYAAQITSTQNCQWRSSAEAFEPGARLALGERLELVAGVADLILVGGARVTLEGPASLQVNSASVVELTRGAAIAHVPPRAEGFVIVTPKAWVIDLGTRFRVVVDEQGGADVQVYEGRVEVQLNAETAPQYEQRTVHLAANQGLQITAERVTHVSGASSDGAPPSATRRVALPLFSTGERLLAGAADPHWELSAADEPPHFAPQAAVVTRPLGGYSQPTPESGQWVSLASEAINLPPGRYFVRTEFELAEVDPATARIEGHFSIDNQITAIRLNGRETSVPSHGDGDFDRAIEFLIETGFRVGVNHLEFELLNTTDAPSPLAVRIDLSGTAERLPTPTTGQLKPTPATPSILNP